MNDKQKVGPVDETEGKKYLLLAFAAFSSIVDDLTCQNCEKYHEKGHYGVLKLNRHNGNRETNDYARRSLE